MHFKIRQEEELADVVKSVLETYNDAKVFLLEGGLGAGKTSMVKVFAKALGYSGTVQSPTYGILNEYPTDRSGKIIHFDLYRLTDLAEAIDIGIEDYLYSNSYCFIEWHEIITPLLPTGCVLIKIQEKEGFREIETSVA